VDVTATVVALGVDDVGGVVVSVAEGEDCGRLVDKVDETAVDSEVIVDVVVMGMTTW